MLESGGTLKGKWNQNITWRFPVESDVISAFDQIDVLNKSANIYMCARSMGFVPDGMSEEQMREISTVFGLPK